MRGHCNILTSETYEHCNICSGARLMNFCWPEISKPGGTCFRSPRICLACPPPPPNQVNILQSIVKSFILFRFSANASPCIMDACQQCGRLDTMVVFLLTCVLIMLMEGFCFWIVKQISLSFLIPWVMALCLGIRLGMNAHVIHALKTP